MLNAGQLHRISIGGDLIWGKVDLSLGGGVLFFFLLYPMELLAQGGALLDRDPPLGRGL